MDTQTITLSTPIEAHGETISTITLRRPKGRELKDMPIKQNMVMGDLFGVAAACADLPVSSLDHLDAADLINIMGVVGGFLGVGSGGTPSS